MLFVFLLKDLSLELLTLALQADALKDFSHGLISERQYLPVPCTLIFPQDSGLGAT